MTLTEYLINFGLIALVLTQVRGRKLTRAGLLFPIAATVFAATQILHSVPTAGNDLVLEIVLAATGAALGIGAGLVTSIHSDGVKTVAKAGVLAATLWVAGIGARIAFSLWVSHGGSKAVEHFSIAHQITSGAAWGAAFFLMAIAEVLARTGIIFWKTRRSGIVLERGGLLRSRLAA